MDISDIFKAILDESDNPNKVSESSTVMITGEENAILGLNEVNIDNSKKSKKSKTSKPKKHRNKITTIDDQNEIVLFSKLNAKIINSTDVTFIQIDDTCSKINESWIGLLGFLIGSVLTNNDINKALGVLTVKPVLSSNIQLYKNQYTHLDSDVNKGIKVYSIIGTEYKLEISSDVTVEELFNSISNMIYNMGIAKNTVYLGLSNLLIQPEGCLDEELNHYSEEIESISIEDLSSEYPNDKLLVGVELFGEVINKPSLIGIVQLIMTFILSIDKSMENEFKSHTIRDVVGITDDATEYLGTMKEYKINSNVYFYSNGSIKSLINYLYNISKSADILSDLRLRFKEIGDI